MWVERNGPTWRVRDLVAGRKVTLAHGLPTKTAAKAVRDQLRADQLRGQALVPRGGQITLAEWAKVWWPSHAAALKPSTAYSEGARLRNHILPALGQQRLEDISELTVQTWLTRLGAQLSPKTVRNCHGLLRRMLAAAVRQRLIRTNPATATTLPRVRRREMRFLTEPEIGRLIAAVPQHWRPLVLLLVATGLRWGEAVALRVGDVDLLASPPRLTVTRTLHEMPGSGEIIYTEPKSVQSRRTVTFPVSVAAQLAALVAGRARHDLVFTSPQGQPVRVRNFRRGWVRWTVAAGLDPARERGQRRVGGLRIHDLRHTHAAALISAGVPLTAVQRRLGHASIAVTSDLYGHLLPEVDAGIVAAVEGAIARVDLEHLQADITAELTAGA